MKNGIIINGVQYEYVQLPDGVQGCEDCAIFEYCGGRYWSVCDIWTGNGQFKLAGV